MGSISTAQSLSMARQIAQSAVSLQEQRLGRRPTSVMVLLGGNTLVIAMHGVLSPAEKLLAARPAGIAKLQEFHQQMFQVSSGPLRQEITTITGLQVCEAIAEDKVTAEAIVQVFPSGTMVQVFLLKGQLPAESWDGN
jgi:uncharacterized protein YbcI